MYTECFAWLPGPFARQRELFHSTEEVREGNLCLQPREWRAQTGMNAKAERDMGIRIASNVEAARVGELPGVAVRGADHRQNELAGRDDLAMHLDLAGRCSRHPLKGRAKAQDFL